MNGQSAMEWFLWVVGVIAAIGAASTYIAKAVKPARDLTKRLDVCEKKLDNDNKRLIEQEEGTRVICKAMLALLDHAVTGNSVERIKDARTTLSDYLINR